MNKSLILFVVMFAVGAAVALIIRTARHEPYAAASVPAPSSTDATPPPESVAQEVVNTICAICGMPVDPSIPPADYQGKKVGFGCRACPPKFSADPDRYGPFALADQEAP